MLMMIVGFWFVQVERLVKLSFGSWVLLGWSLAVGVWIRQLVDLWNLTPEALVLGVKYSSLADFFLNAQPTIMLVSSGLLLWFFLRYGQLKLANTEDILQKIFWPILSMGSLVSFIWLSLFTVWGGLYDWVFGQGDLAKYGAWFPVFVMAMALVSLLCASKVNIKLSFSTNPAE